MREQSRCAFLHAQWLGKGSHTLNAASAREMGLAIGRTAPRTINVGDGGSQAAVVSARLARRRAPQGLLSDDWVIIIQQRRRGYLDPNLQKTQDEGARRTEPDFFLAGGCTLLVDAATRRIRWCIAKNISSEERLTARREKLLDRPGEAEAMAKTQEARGGEPFAVLRDDHFTSLSDQRP